MIYRTVTVTPTIFNSIISADINYYTKVRTYGRQTEFYEGPYEVTPDFNGVELQTYDKLMRDNMTVNPIQVETVANTSGGNTVYIGGIV